MNAGQMPLADRPIKALSQRGADFIRRHEGYVSKAYRCPAGKWTIGSGFTWGSQVFRDHWLKTRGHKLRRGDTIDKAENDQLLQAAANDEYGAAVVKALAPRQQHVYDAATSVAFNCGPGTLRDRWAKAVKAGDIAGGAALLKKTRVTGGGKRLRGLVIRRADEARLLEFADYGDGGAKKAGHALGKVGRGRSRDVEIIRDYQEKLIRLGFDVGPGGADGAFGRNSRAAVLKFQQTRPDLVDDGILGRATMAQIDRSIDKRSEPVTKGGAIAAAGIAAVATVNEVAPDWIAWAIGGAIVAVAAVGIYLAWKHWGDL